MDKRPGYYILMLLFAIISSLSPCIIFAFFMFLLYLISHFNKSISLCLFLTDQCSPSGAEERAMCISLCFPNAKARESLDHKFMPKQSNIKYFNRKMVSVLIPVRLCELQNFSFPKISSSCSSVNRSSHRLT